MHQAVVWRVQRLAPGIHQLQQKRVPAGAQAAQPKRFLVIQQEHVAVEADPQSPAVVAITQVLKGRIQQDPVERQWLMGRDHRRQQGNQLGRAGGRASQRVGGGPVQADLGEGAGIAHRLAPGHGSDDAEPVATGRQGRHLNAGGGQPQGWGLIQLHHKMGAQSLGSRGLQRPVAQLQLQGPGSGGHQAVGLGRNDAQPRLMGLQ
jgi:hypothetical protein